MNNNSNKKKKIKKSTTVSEQIDVNADTERLDSLVNLADLPTNIPVLAAGDLVAFPTVLMSLYIVDEKNKNAIQKATEQKNLILMVATNKQPGDRFKLTDLPKIGVAAKISKVFKLNDGRIKVLLQGVSRVKVHNYIAVKDYFSADVEYLESKTLKSTAEVKALVEAIRQKLQTLVELELLPEEMLLITEEIKDPAVLADVVIAHYKLDVTYAQNLLEELDPLKRLKLTAKLIEDDFNNFIVAENIRTKTQDELSKGQKDYFLREQLKQIRKELGEEDYVSEDIAEIRKALAKANLPKHARDESDRQLKRLERMSMESSEYGMLRTYLEWIADLPWAKTTKEKFDLKNAQKILDNDHYGLSKTKDRILEFLSVRKLKSDSKGPILCFVGPPGVGKTSLGKSIAAALNRSFVRLSIGGVRDEAEIRGHRRTYVGALPGRILQGIKDAGSSNPVFVLDELDKIGSDYRGDPSSALLEVLDPQQNKNFSDHYLNISYDLSDCFFIATANTLDTIPDALLDRLEVISIPGYTNTEKVQIAEKYLIPRQIKENGLEKQKIKFSKEATLSLIEDYTKESGVRGLEREIAAVCRKLAREIVGKKNIPNNISSKFVNDCLGPTKFQPDFYLKEDQVGLANGLAWTIYGGEIMPVEVSVAPGKGDLTLTGQLGNILQESAQAAVFYARANAKELGLADRFNEALDIHIHLPEGATPKDGPSAGVTLITGLVSAVAGRKVKSNVAMTGEITLRGNVLAIGGLKEKALAALRNGIKRIIIPADNLKDLAEIPTAQREEIEFIPVKTIHEVLKYSLEPLKKNSGSKLKKKTSGRKIVKKATIKNVA